MRKGYRGIRKALAAFTAVGLLFTSSPAVFGYNVAAGQFEFAGAYSGKVNISGPREGQSGSVISGASGGGYGTATLVSGGVHRIYFDFESTYTYNAGDLLSIRYSSSLDLSADEAIIAFSDATEGHINLGSPSSVSSGYMTYTLPADTNGRFASKQPTYVRLKGNNGSAPTIVFSGVEIHSAGTLPSFAGGSVVDDTTDVFGKPTSGADWTVSNTANGGKATYTSTNGSPTYRATVPLSDYTYVAGHLISVRYENVDITGQEFIIGYDTGSNFITIGNPVSYHEGYMTFELPEDTKGIFASKQPTFVRIKGNYAGAVAGTSFRLDGVDIHKKGTRPVWDDGSIREIFPEAVATGVAVTYYDGIYSRGFAWCTDEHCLTGKVDIIKKSGNMTASNVDWTNATSIDATSSRVERIETNSSFPELNGKKWHYFKAHIENLEPGATYFYRCGNASDGFSDVGTIVVEKPADQINELTFIHTTDSQMDYLYQFEKWADAAFFIFKKW